MANPLYRQIAEDLRQQIESGQLEPGQQLQTELELRERYDASRNTIRDAIKFSLKSGTPQSRPAEGPRLHPADRLAGQRRRGRCAANGSAAEDGIALIEDGGLASGYAARGAVQKDVQRIVR
jgi:DNA-binding FadR family transcriptional regulator